MKEIEGAKLADLVEEAKISIIQDQRKEAGSTIRQIFQRRIALGEEQRKKESELFKIRKKLESIDIKIKKLMDGDWSALEGNVDQLEKIETQKGDYAIQGTH